MKCQKEEKQWQELVAKRRHELFRTDWKNPRKVIQLQSLVDAETIDFAIDWRDESGELVERIQEKVRLNRMIEQGLDVNMPREQYQESE